MLFSSMTFIYLFLPIVVTIYIIVRKELRNYILLIASLIFYAWGEPKYLSIMLLTILANYIFAIFIEYSKNTQLNVFFYSKKSLYSSIIKFRTNILLFVALFIDLGILAYFKYFNFLIDNINLLFQSNVDFIKVIMPIGISFYTFQAISYLIDVYRGGEAQKDLFKLSLFIALFPQLIAGPIVKYHEISI